ncbi:predicted protein [Histoplasma capsulatum var. duboisii H88]|uniref:Predicted protein n=1 Tax=Ajellomyces capsulatus (strain H88) TaxID=544711 RepID=F0UE47_AJEC8|nr:predicted protein [Histoplasma capsulatum var. duboisii H88]
METINSRHNCNLSNVAKFVPKRHRKRLRDNIMGITKPTIRYVYENPKYLGLLHFKVGDYQNPLESTPFLPRLARRGGVIRIQKDIYDTVRSVVLERLRETVTTRDVSSVHIAWHGKSCLRF